MTALMILSSKYEIVGLPELVAITAVSNGFQRYRCGIVERKLDAWSLAGQHSRS